MRKWLQINKTPFVTAELALTFATEFAMPANLQPIPDAAFDAILDGQGHDPCPGVTLRSDIEIRPTSAAHPRQYVAIYEPAVRSASPAPALLAFHGGGFCLGDPHGCGALAKTLALSLGVVTVSASYRLGTSENPTGFGILDDAAHAWDWIHKNAAALNIDPMRIAVHGESAGCLLAGHLAVQSCFVAAPNLPRPAALYAFWGPLDFVARWYDKGENNGAEINILGPGGFLKQPTAYHQLGALSHAQAPLPPALFIYGRNDTVVHPRQGILAAAAWTNARAHAETFILPNIGHNTSGDNRPQRRQLLEKATTFCSWRHAV
jgi:acetyl esterase/lipase